MIKICKTRGIPSSSFLSPQYSKGFLKKLRLMQWVWRTGEQTRCTVSPFKFSGTYSESKHESEIATAVSFRFVGVTGPSAETDSKQKKTITRQNGVWGNNPRITWYSIQKGTDSIQQDRPLSKKTDSRQRDRLKTKDWLDTQARIYKVSVHSHSKNACRTPHSKYIRCRPQVGHLLITYLQYLCPQNPIAEW